MPTERLYYTDAYLLEFDATVAEVIADAHGFRTRLDRTAFYPTSGGQSHDLGVLGNAAIVEVVVTDGEIWHITNSSPGEKLTEVRGAVDHIRRRRNRQIHTAQHVVSAVLLRDFAAETTSVHLGDEYGAIDVINSTLTVDQLDQVNGLLQAVVEAALPIHIHFATEEEIDRYPLRRPPKKSGTIRIVAIGELDYSACGGTHCRSTAELIGIRITGVQRRHGKQSITFIAGDQLLEDYALRVHVTDALMLKYNCKIAHIPERIAGLEQAIRDARLLTDSSIRELLPIWAKQAIVSRKNNLTVSWHPTLTKEQGIELGNLISTDVQGSVLIGCCDATLLMCSGTSLSARTLMNSLIQEFGLRGGGTDQLAQTSALTEDQFHAAAERLRSLVI